MNKIQALQKIQLYCPDEFLESKERWGIEDFIHYLYDSANCEIVERTISEEEIEKIDK